MRELQNNLALKLRVPEDGLTVNGILRELEAQTPMIFNALLKSIFKAWDTIRHDLENRLNYGKLEVLFSDGGPGIEENLLAEGMRLQRCLWHGEQDFPFLMYADWLKKAEQQLFQSPFGQIPAFDFTKEWLEKLDPAELETIHQLFQKTQQGFEQLLEALDQNEYPKARTYIRNLYQHTMTFLDYWLQSSSWLPLNINDIESAFSRIANHSKKIGQRLSDRDLFKWFIQQPQYFFLKDCSDD